MPIKFKPTVTVVDRNSGKKSYQNHYMHMQKTEDLIEEINKDNPNKKRRAKAIRELERRSIKIAWVKKSEDSII